MKFNEKTFYAYKFMSECLPIYAFYALLFLEHGQTLSEVAILIALWSFFAIIFEIPTGLLADRINRQTMLVIGCLLKGLCFLIWNFSHNFWLFALGFFFWALGGALASGTEESLIFDSLKNESRQEEFTAIYGKVEFFGTIGAMIGIVSAGILASFFSLRTIALISAVISIIDAIFAVNIRGMKLHRSNASEKKEKIWDTFNSAIGFIKESKVAFIIIAFIVLVVSLGFYLDEFDALIIADFELEMFWVTVIFMIRFAFMALGDLLAPTVGKYVKSVKSVIPLAGLGCLLLGIFALLWHPFAMVIFGLPFLVLAIVNVLLVNQLNQEIKEEARATVMSVVRVGQNFGMIVLALVYGWLSGILALQYTYLLIALFGVVTTGIFLFIVRKKT